MLGAVVLCLLAHSVLGRTPNEQVVFDHVASNANLTFRSPSGILKYPYLVPAGPYNELWDWDSVLLGVATLQFGSAPYLAGSMKNFLALTNITSGEVAGALTPDGPVPAVYHAKPIIIQGAWLVAKNTNDYEQFFAFQPQMEALLSYWDTTRFHNESGLYVWFDQMETGCDNLVTSFCPNWMSLECWTNSQALSLSATDLMVWLAREHHAYANFLQVWSKLGLTVPSRAEVHMARSKSIVSSMDTYLWNESLGYYLAFNTTSNSSITNRVFYMAWPVFAGLLDADQARRATEALTQSDMFTEFGIRSTSSLDPRYTNVNEIFPYSNWRGPIWVLVNALLAYGYNDLATLYPEALVTVGSSPMSYSSLAADIATRIVSTLAADLNATQTWHECYSSDSGAGLAAPGFLSFNTLGATLLENLGNNINPFSI